MVQPPTYISDFIQNNFIEKVNKATSISIYRKFISNNSKILHKDNNEHKISLKTSFTSNIEDFSNSESSSKNILNDENCKTFSRKNVYEDFKESMATIATNRRVSSDKLFSKTFSQSQKIYQILSSHETPLSSFYRNIITSAHNVNKQSYFEKNNKNLKNIHREFNIKLDMEAEDKNNSNNNNKNNKNNNEMHTNKNGFSFREKQFLDKKYINAYIKTEPCCVSRKNESDLWEEYKQNNEKPKKKSRINKIYSMQPTINNHVKSKLDGKNKNGSNTVTTEEEFESEEISEGNINIDDINRIKKLEISEGIIYGKGGIPKSKSQFSYNFENLEQENKENIDKTQNFNIVTKKKKKSLKKKLLRRLKI